MVYNINDIENIYLSLTLRKLYIYTPRPHTLSSIYIRESIYSIDQFFIFFLPKQYYLKNGSSEPI